MTDDGAAARSDYSALFCRPPTGGQPPAQPEHLAFLHRILRDNARDSSQSESDSQTDSGSDARSMSASGILDEDDTELIPPENFAMVNSWLYRSSFPKKKHFNFLKTLGLRSVLCVSADQHTHPRGLSRAEYRLSRREWYYFLSVWYPW